MSIVMRPSKALPQVFIYRDPVDFRKVHRGLAAIVEIELGHNLFDGHLCAFTHRQHNKIKCLFWEDTGFVLYYKSLSEEKFKWPKRTEELLTKGLQKQRSTKTVHCIKAAASSPLS